mgnify:CR=1 FL=1
MRIIFKTIYIRNQEIVTFELNEPWQTCYDEGLKMDSRFRGNDSVEKWNNTSKIPQQTATPSEKLQSKLPACRQAGACFWRLTAAK